MRGLLILLAVAVVLPASAGATPVFEPGRVFCPDSGGCPPRKHKPPRLVEGRLFVGGHARAGWTIRAAGGKEQTRTRAGGTFGLSVFPTTRALAIQAPSGRVCSYARLPEAEGANIGRVNCP